MPTYRVLIFGIGKTADVVHHQLVNDSDLDVAAFVVDGEYLPQDRTKNGLPVVDFETVAEQFDPGEYKFFVAIGYQNLNADRVAVIERVKTAGYQLASYISPQALTTGPIKHGEHCFVMEHAVIQPLVELGSDVWIWSGAIVAHHACIGDHAWIASGATIGGGAKVGARCFLGMGAVVGHEVQIGPGSLLGGGALVLKDAPEDSVYIAPETPRFRLNATQFLRMTKLR